MILQTRSGRFPRPQIGGFRTRVGHIIWAMSRLGSHNDTLVCRLTTPTADPESFSICQLALGGAPFLHSSAIRTTSLAAPVGVWPSRKKSYSWENHFGSQSLTPTIKVVGTRIADHVQSIDAAINEQRRNPPKGFLACKSENNASSQADVVPLWAPVLCSRRGAFDASTFIEKL